MTVDVLRERFVQGNREMLIISALLLAGTALLTYWIINDQGRLAMAGGIFMLLLGMAWARPQWAIFGSLVFLTFIGDLRRWLIAITSWSGQDPLLLVVPAIALLLVMSPAVQRRVKADTVIAKLVLVLMAVMTLQIMNPAQGGLAVGLGGALFYLVPLLWFWVGRIYATPELMSRITYVLILPLAILAALFGLFQTFYGLPAYQQTWVDLAGHIALYVHGTVRAFSFFPSSVEHALYLNIATIALWAAFLRGYRAAILPIPLLIYGVFLVGSRGPFVIVLLTMIIMWTVMGRDVKVWLPRLALAVVVGGVGLVWSLNQVKQADISEQISAFVDHQTTGLLNPLDREQSTAMGHIEMKLAGFTRALESPLGLGLGSTTLAGSRFGTSGLSTELDITDMFVALGLVGGLLYLAIVILVFYYTIRYWVQKRTLLALVSIGVLFVVFGGWLLGGRYAISAIVWLYIGAIDRFKRDDIE